MQRRINKKKTDFCETTPILNDASLRQLGKQNSQQFKSYFHFNTDQRAVEEDCSEESTPYFKQENDHY